MDDVAVADLGEIMNPHPCFSTVVGGFTNTRGIGIG